MPRIRNDAHKLIEEAMLAANVCSADFIERAKHPALYRVHEGPTPEKRVLLQNYLKALGLGLSITDEPKPGEYQVIAEATKDRPDATQIHTMLLRSMQQAIYTASNIGHFGLAYEAYTHFTSPIRRYPDLLVHRVIKALLSGQALSPRTGHAEAPRRASSRSAASRAKRRRRKSSNGRSPARIAAPTSGAPTKPRATSRHGSSAATCASTSARSTAAPSARSRASACSCSSMACMSKGWCTSPSSAASTSASTKCARNCAASARAFATPSALACGCRSAGSISTDARSTSAWCTKVRRNALRRGRVATSSASAPARRATSWRPSSTTTGRSRRRAASRTRTAAAVANTAAKVTPTASGKAGRRVARTRVRR